MPNTTSGTATFDKTFAIEEIIEDAFERIGLNSVAGYQLKSARRSLNILFQEWGNRGIHYWEVGSTNLDLIEGQADYDFFRSSDDGTSATTTDPASVFGMSDVAEQLKNDPNLLKEEDFNVRKTWTEYINRLFGFLAGNSLLIIFFWITLYYRENKRLFLVSFVNLILIAFQANKSLFSFSMFLTSLFCILLMKTIVSNQRTSG